MGESTSDKPRGKDRAELLSIKTAASTNQAITYYAAWCASCEQARHSSLRNGISFVEYDIEKNQNARRAYDAVGGNAVLVILVGNKRLSAFTVVELKNIYP